ncbi:MAG TPA: lytic transglycosylase F [Xanthomonadales bacterium]
MLLIKNLLVAVFVLALVACDNSSATAVKSASFVRDGRSGSEAEQLEQSLSNIEAQMGMKLMDKPWTGDLDIMTDKRIIRVLTVYGLGRYYLDGGQEKGMTYEWFKMFEDYVNAQARTKHLKIHVLFIPVARDQLIPGLISGRGDIAAAGLTITPERAAVIDFTNPVSEELSEVLVTGPSAPQIDTLEDLAGKVVYVRASSSYRSSLDALNLRFAQQGLAEIEIRDAPEALEDEDLLEMVNAGLLEWAVIDDYKAKIWADIFDDLKVRDDLVLRSGGRIGFAIRKSSPQLAAALNEFLKTHKQGTLKGNILINRYLKDFDWAKNALAAEDYQRFENVADIFMKYGRAYGVDYLMVTAQGYQESRLDQSVRSPSGAIGIMQLLPSTAADANVGIPDITTAEPNIHAGVKYLDFIRKRYFSDPQMDAFNQTMFAFAAYNAGPARVQKLREKAAERGYNPNQWFDNVEVMAAADIGAETVQYVANILKYYIAYSLTVQKQLERDQARKGAGIK